MTVMIEVVLALLIAAVSYVLQYMFERMQFWRRKRKYIQQNSVYMEQLEKMDAEYHPERPDVKLALRCKEYLSQEFPYGIKERTENMSREELSNLFEKMVEDARQMMDVNLDTVDFYTSDEAPACDYCGYYSHSDRSLHINAALILSGKPQLIEEQVYTIFHELKHARQWAAVEGKLNDVKDYGYSDEQIRIWAENFDHYIPISVSDELYRKQPVESDAFGFETILKGERQFEII